MMAPIRAARDRIKFMAGLESEGHEGQFLASALLRGSQRGTRSRAEGLR
jgi:hypothetical protein